MNSSALFLDRDTSVASEFETPRSSHRGWRSRSRRARQHADLGWRHKTNFDTLVADMVDAVRVAIRDERERRNRHG
jgi:hypothetical protein